MTMILSLACKAFLLVSVRKADLRVVVGQQLYPVLSSVVQRRDCLDLSQPRLSSVFSYQADRSLNICCVAVLIETMTLLQINCWLDSQALNPFSAWLFLSPNNDALYLLDEQGVALKLSSTSLAVVASYNLPQSYLQPWNTATVSAATISPVRSRTACYRPDGLRDRTVSRPNSPFPACVFSAPNGSVNPLADSAFVFRVGHEPKNDPSRIVCVCAAGYYSPNNSVVL